MVTGPVTLSCEHFVIWEILSEWSRFIYLKETVLQQAGNSWRPGYEVKVAGVNLKDCIR